MNNKRICESCKHSWVAHGKIFFSKRENILYHIKFIEIHFFFSFQAITKIRNTESENAVPDLEAIYELASLILFGAQAIPIRIKIMFDRLLANLSQEEVLKVISSFGWSYQDYARGYILSSVRYYYSRFFD